MSGEAENLTGKAPATPESQSNLLPQTVTCPFCNTNVPYAIFCSNCGTNLPPVFVPPVSAGIPHRRSRALVLGTVLVIVLAVSITGVAGYVMYQDRQQSFQQAAANSELLAANQAIARLTFTCFSSHTDTSTLNNTIPPYGYLTLYERFGVYNPSQYSMDTTWILTFNYTSVHVVLSSLHAFHLSGKSTSYPEFSFLVTANQASMLASTHGPPQFIATLDGTYLVIGSYSMYHVSQHQTHDSSANSGAQEVLGGSASGPVPACA